MQPVGEALIRCAEMKKRFAQLPERFAASALVQEGDEPPERPEMLLAELDDLAQELEQLIARVNLTNAATRLPQGLTVTEALARRDVLALRATVLRAAIRAATERGLIGRYGRSEIRVIRVLNVAALQDQLEALTRTRRELETELQRHNWTTPLLDGGQAGATAAPDP
jgi:hypothetical protein